jgi:Flp pilus assembly protein TadG
MPARTQPIHVLTLLHRLLSDRRGAAVVEAALVLPLVIGLSLGAIETARAVSAKAAISHAVKETARFAAVRGEASKADEATQADLEGMAVRLAALPASSVSANVSWEPNTSPGSLVLVQMQHTFRPIAPFLPDSLTLSSTASMTVIR